jgi:hypothetical protein
VEGYFCWQAGDYFFLGEGKPLRVLRQNLAHWGGGMVFRWCRKIGGFFIYQREAGLGAENS